jgi:hypothetical protein
MTATTKGTLPDEIFFYWHDPDEWKGILFTLGDMFWGSGSSPEAAKKSARKKAGVKIEPPCDAGYSGCAGRNDCFLLVLNPHGGPALRADVLCPGPSATIIASQAVAAHRANRGGE